MQKGFPLAVFLLFFLFRILPDYAQQDSQALLARVKESNPKAFQLSKKHVTYYWTGRSCPHFDKCQDVYGFKIKCKGCMVTGHVIRHNRRAIRKINAVYGANWFEEHKSGFYYGS
jgi:hypothetical protein